MKILMVILLSIMAFIIWSAIFYDLFGWFKGFYHDILDWHIPDTKKKKKACIQQKIVIYYQSLCVCHTKKAVRCRG